MFTAMMDTWSSLALSPWNADPFRLSSAFMPSQPASAGHFLTDSFTSDNGSLRYKLFVPSQYSGAPLPLIVMLHGCGQDADDFASGTGMNMLAERANCLVAYPEQSSSANSNRCWNWFEKNHHERGRGEPALLAGLTRKIMTEYAVDATRVSIAGLSAGGAMAVIMGRNYPELFSAVGCHSGLPHGSAKDLYGAMVAMREGASDGALVRSGAAGSVPIIVFHGDMDSTVHWKNSNGVVRQSLDSYTAQARSRAALQLRQETGHESGRHYTRSVHRSNTGRVVAEQWTVHGTGHAWSGGNPRGSYADPRGPDATRAMLGFFLQTSSA